MSDKRAEALDAAESCIRDIAQDLIDASFSVGLRDTTAARRDAEALMVNATRLLGHLSEAEAIDDASMSLRQGAMAAMVPTPPGVPTKAKKIRIEGEVTGHPPILSIGPAPSQAVPTLAAWCEPYPTHVGQWVRIVKGGHVGKEGPVVELTSEGLDGREQVVIDAAAPMEF